MSVDVSFDLPMNGQRVLAWGHATYCCEEDMDDKPNWHVVIYNDNGWDLDGEGCEGHLECVTHWYPIPDSPPLNQFIIREFYNDIVKGNCSDYAKDKMLFQYPFLKEST